MASVFDVATYIIEQLGEMTAMKLQKLVYYSQAWSLVWDEEILFDSPIEAWVNGPVIRELYEAHKGIFKVNQGIFVNGSASNLTPLQKETIDGVLDFYGDKKSQWLSDLTHLEEPWKKAREEAGIKEGERGNAIIKIADMHEYYSGLSVTKFSV